MNETKLFLVVVDETPECLKAMRFAARRAQNTGRGVAMLYIVEPDGFQHWQVVANAMRAEAFKAAETRLVTLAAEIKALTGIDPTYSIKEGSKRDKVLEYMRENGDVSLLVLGAGSGGEGPGPLVSSLGGQMSGTLKFPVTIVPGAMSFEEIDAVC